MIQLPQNPHQTNKLNTGNHRISNEKYVENVVTLRRSCRTHV